MQHMFNDCYTPDKASRKDPLISPSAVDPTEFPPTVLTLTYERDIFEPEASALAVKLDDGKRRLIHHMARDVHHGFDKGCEEGTIECTRRNDAYALVVLVVVLPGCLDLTLFDVR
jgi:acetyl esterase/lipase